jgi:alanyl-tRNA synthetase
MFNTLDRIRQVFLSYFEKSGHKVVSSSKLVPENDATLLFTNAGMNQFKDYFTGQKPPPFKTATTAQKCVRAGGKHNDLKNVGYTARHHTFFEMLGNFSFGDYFKEEAIYHAWQVVTKEFALPPDKLCVTVFADDDEAREIWKKITGFPDSKIIRISTSDNFWEMGPTGPCGPCTEIFYDHGDSVLGGPPGSKEADGDRFTEVWNLVFMQYDQQTPETRVTLPVPCVDTGMGLERIAAILQGKHNNFDIDLFVALIAKIRAVLRGNDAHSCNVIADHIRSISFLIADGVLPLNEGRGYVLRRIIRRAFRHARALGAKGPVLYRFVDSLGELMGTQYPELIARAAFIKDVLKGEEERFDKTLDNGLKLLDESLTELQGAILPGSVAFKLYDTYGFPVDLTIDLLKDKGISVDMDGFKKFMEKQRDDSKKFGTLGLKVQSGNVNLAGIPETIPEYYRSSNDTEAEVLAVVDLGNGRNGVVLDHSQFFPESCGQANDTGLIVTGKAFFRVLKTYKCDKWIIHEGVNEKFPLAIGDKVTAKLDTVRRNRIRAHHSATHLIQAELRAQLGTSVEQKGAYCDDKRLRFDYSCSEKVTDEVIQQVETRMNQWALQSTHCEAVVCSKNDPIAKEALAFFDEKYDDMVRVIRLGQLELGNFGSIELCGGIHVSNTGQIGNTKVISDRSISAGIRRIEAVCGLALIEWLDETVLTLSSESAQLKAESKLLEKQLRNARKAGIEIDVKTERIGGVALAHHQVKTNDATEIREIAEKVQKNLEEGIAVVSGDAVIVVCVAEKSNIDANKLIQGLCERFGCRGGGKSKIAQVGGVTSLQEALHFLREKLTAL